MAMLPSVFVLRQQLSTLLKLNLPTYRTLQEYRKQGNKIRTAVFNAHFKSARDFETRKSSMIDYPSTKRVSDEAYTISATKMRTKYAHIFRTESWNNTSKQVEEKYFTLSSSQRFSPDTALKHLRDKVETGDDMYGFIIEKAWFLGGMKRGERVY